MRDNIFVNDPEFDHLPTTKLIELSNSKLILERSRSLNALARRSSQDPTLVNYVMEAIVDPKNTGAKFMGTITLSHMAFACLWVFGTPTAKEALKRILSAWPEPDRSDLIWFLESQDLSVDDLALHHQSTAVT